MQAMANLTSRCCRTNFTLCSIFAADAERYCPRERYRFDVEVLEPWRDATLAATPGERGGERALAAAPLA